MSLAAAGLIQEWGVRRRTHIGPVDSWYDTWLVARNMWEDERHDGARLIMRYTTVTVVAA
jgi:hypothetical protein